jgi:hypothetical protein
VFAKLLNFIPLIFKSLLFGAHSDIAVNHIFLPIGNTSILPFGAKNATKIKSAIQSMALNEHWTISQRLGFQ